ncbi:unnamed protein product [Prorocentrum cordatum]|uniref:RWD domain-containing protein n=1 Tax=Prorocentrum cordatum TaxID=2364126 RepID=A0ABN9WBV6_9DINO|nr:unnamed protein product [Polarella glacialis]
MANAAQQIAELKTLRKEYKAEGVFEFLGPKPADATDESPTRFKIRREAPVPMTVVVSMPVGYPADAPPLFKVEGVEGSLEAVYVEAIEELLITQASYMRGMECISTVLQSLDDLELDSLDIGEPGRCRSIFKIDVVNNSPQFTKSLKQKSAVEFMKAIRTDGDMDCDMLGKPCRIQMTVVEEFEMAPKAAAIPDGFSSTEYRTDEDLDALMNPYMAAAAGLVAKK